MTQTKSILVLNGPNLNMLGTREPDLYGTTTLAMIEADCVKRGKALGLEVTCQQSNDEGTLVTLIQQAIGTYDAIIFNAAAYTHTSVALRDALAMFNGISVEVHISNVYKRDDFRHKSLLAGVVTGVISGFGAASYAAAITAVHENLSQKQ
ncbi:MAG: type II 3-dehydroquinate dehydratase [Candidatus Puniceispirillaceae bacterium]